MRGKDEALIAHHLLLASAILEKIFFGLQNKPSVLKPTTRHREVMSISMVYMIIAKPIRMGKLEVGSGTQWYIESDVPIRSLQHRAGDVRRYTLMDLTNSNKY